MTTTEFFAGFDSPQNMAMVDIHYDADGSLYVLSLQFKDTNDYRVDPDGTKSYLSDVVLTKIVGQEIVDQSIFDTTYSGYDNYSSGLSRGTMQITESGIKVFLSEKAIDTSYGQDGYIYNVNKETLDLATARETLFTAANWGWHPYFDNDGNVNHFSFSGYYQMVNTTQIGAMDPGDSVKLQWENHIQTDALDLDIATLESWEQLSDAMVAKAMEVIGTDEINHAPVIATPTELNDPGSVGFGRIDMDSFNQLAQTITFSEFADYTANPIYTIDVTGLGNVEVSFGGTFIGQVASGDYVVTLSDILPDGTLQIDTNASLSFTAYDGANPSSPVLSGTPTFNGPIAVLFSQPVAAVGLEGGYFDAINGTSITAFNAAGQIIGSIENTAIGIEFFGLGTMDGSPQIKGISFYITGDEPAGFAIDNLTIGSTGSYVLVGAPDTNGVVIELTTIPDSETLTDSGTIGFTDADITDFHSISTVMASTGALGTLTPTITKDTTGSGLNGVVTWNYNVAASAVEYLTEDEQKIETFTFSVLDGHGGSVECAVDVAVMGTYDDTTAPTLTTSTPSDDATAVAVDNNITLTFDENVHAGTGNIVISNGSDIRTIDVADTTQVTFDGSMVTINPTDDLQAGTSYHVAMASGVIKDMGGNAYEGISDATALNFSTVNSDPNHHDLTGHITFWKTGEAITDVTTTLTALPTDGTHAFEFRNIHVAADGSHTVEVWKTATEGNIGSVEFECVLPTSASATWQDAKELPNGWSSYASPNESGNYSVALMAGMSLATLGEGAVKLGTLTIAEPAPSNHFELLLASGMVGDNNVQGFGIVSDSASTGNDNYYHYINIADSTYALTANKVAGEKEASAIHANDAYAALKMAVSLNPNGDGSAVLPYQYLAADINHDGKVRANDAFNILKMAVGVASAPAEEWIFVSEEVADKTMDRSHVDWSDIVPTIDFNHHAVELDLIGIVKGDVDGSWAA
ncbi:MAG: Ig-like domain-containing protein [Chlorobium sp.]